MLLSDVFISYPLTTLENNYTAAVSQDELAT
jgi:hypothetical protein